MPIFIKQDQRKVNIGTIPKSLVASINSNLLEEFLKNKDQSNDNSEKSKKQKNDLVLSILSNFGSSK